MTRSTDGKGRTLFEIITGRNKRDMTPIELQYHNPLDAKVGCSISFDHESEFEGINFFIEKIAVYKTVIGSRDFYHTDYCLCGNSLSIKRPIRLRLRLIDDEDEANDIGCKFQILRQIDEMGWDEGFHNYVCNPEVFDEDGKVTDVAFCIKEDTEGNVLEDPEMFWRIEDVTDPYSAKQTILADDDGSGTIEDDELEHNEMTYWDFSRLTEKEGVEVTEYLWVEMEDAIRYFTLYRGTEIDSSQVWVI